MGTMDDDEKVFGVIKQGKATHSDLNLQLGHCMSNREIDRACQRLRRAGKVKFAGVKTGWVLARDTAKKAS